jgi:hypothetical protein
VPDHAAFPGSFQTAARTRGCRFAPAAWSTRQHTFTIPGESGLGRTLALLRLNDHQFKGVITKSLISNTP